MGIANKLTSTHYFG